jgi:signal transduction histidine kinase
MDTPLKVLLVEDAEDDALLVLRHLRRGGFVPSAERVETSEQMLHALDEGGWDVVIADFNLPRFDGFSALELLRASQLDVPFLLVSGTIGEDMAVEAMRAGAQDYVMKDKLERLPGAVARELDAARERRERRELEVNLAQSDRLACMGMLAAGVAHEINNPLAYVMLHLEAIQSQLEVLVDQGADPEMGEWVSSALEGTGRIASIVKDLKSFSRVESGAHLMLDLRGIVDGAATMARNEIKHRARLVRDYQDVPPVLGSEGRLSQVFLNLLVNAAQAIPDGDAENNEIRVEIGLEHQRVVVRVRDSGHGLDSHHAERALEPFFTTKAPGEGTGLGLAICQRILTEHGGTIGLESVPGVGTEVTVRLPAAIEHPRETETHAGEDGLLPPHGLRRRVLVVDDEPNLCRSLARALRREHEVIVATSGEEARDILAADWGFDVVLCDVMMPRCSGMDLHAWLAQHIPELLPRLVFMTGGAFTSEAQAFLTGVDNHRIDKPFDWQLLRRTIREVAP